jgi:hypothetical protein
LNNKIFYVGQDKIKKINNYLNIIDIFKMKGEFKK